LIIYIDAGLTGKEEIIGKILGHVDGYIYSQYHHNHIRYLSFFGVDKDKLTGPRPVRGHGGITASTWRGIITQHLLATPPVDPAFIPRLHNAGSSNTRLPERKDLVLFFCSGRDVSTTVDTQKRLEFIKRNCIWFIFDEADELPFCEAGKFVTVAKDTIDLC
jgi:hypothetical protein